MSTDITVDDFMTGVIAACKAKGYQSISMRDERFYRGMKAGFDELQREATEHDLDVRFWVFLDQFHHDSPVISEAVRGAVVRNLVSLDNPEFVNMRIKVDVPTAESLLDRLPGGADLYLRLADVFLSSASAPVGADA
ncbi:hypothetical protein [Nocardioides sp.]|uniref:hypothetical protein n=1 Tax=Nocardioides sp. TaxID=35761 RepID=UPI003782E031